MLGGTPNVTLFVMLITAIVNGQATPAPTLVANSTFAMILAQGHTRKAKNAPIVTVVAAPVRPDRAFH